MQAGVEERKLTDKLSVLADRWWPVFLVAFGTAFILGVPFHYTYPW